MVGGPVETSSLRAWGKDRSKDPQEELSWPLRSWPIELGQGLWPHQNFCLFSDGELERPPALLAGCSKL